MQRPEPVENWWTRRTSSTNNRTPVEIATTRVRYYLTIYPQLEGAALYASALWGADDDAPKLFVVTAEDYLGGPAWEENACIKADLDRALGRCTRVQQRAVQAKFHEGVDYRTAAARLKQSRSNIHEQCRKAIGKMGKILAGTPDKSGSCNEGIHERTHIASPGR